MKELKLLVTVRYPASLDEEIVKDAVESTLVTEFYVTREDDPPADHHLATFVVEHVSPHRG